jgi:DNA-binding MarR family transcriptional regulator
VTAEPLPLLACACASLRRAARAVTQSYEAELQSAGLRATQFTLLQALERTGACVQGALGELLALDPTTLSRTLRPLERAGWIRAAPGLDRREVRWTLTAAGRRRFSRALPAWERAQARLRARLRPEHWAVLVEDLAAVAAAARITSLRPRSRRVATARARRAGGGKR